MLAFKDPLAKLDLAVAWLRYVNYNSITYHLSVFISRIEWKRRLNRTTDDVERDLTTWTALNFQSVLILICYFPRPTTVNQKKKYVYVEENSHRCSTRHNSSNSQFHLKQFHLKQMNCLIIIIVFLSVKNHFMHGLHLTCTCTCMHVMWCYLVKVKQTTVAKNPGPHSSPKQILQKRSSTHELHNQL